MDRANESDLVKAALAARKRAVASISKFKVGAALEDRRGRIYTGANVENVTLGLTCCAERVALFKALTEGARGFVRIAVVGRWKGGPMPCGACRQLLAEFAPKAVVLIVDSMRPAVVRRVSVEALLPEAFVSFGPR